MGEWNDDYQKLIPRQISFAFRLDRMKINTTVVPFETIYISFQFNGTLFKFNSGTGR